MIYIIIIGLLAAILAVPLHGFSPKRVGMWLSIVPLGIFIWGISNLNRVIDVGHFTETLEWVKSINLNLSFRLDGLSLFFVLLISGFGFFIFNYANSYLQNDTSKGRFFLYLSLFMTAMLGIVMSNNLIVLFIFWELTSLSSYLLIGYYHHQEESRKSALMAMLVTVMGGLFMLAGFILLGIEVGTFNITKILTNPSTLNGNKLKPVIAGLILIGALTKSAQFPFHFWLPNAMAAPAPVSAYLHSTTMVKAGVFLIARLSPIFNNTDVWTLTLIHLGGITMVYGALVAITHTDMKKVLAYTTISALGIMMLLLGIGTTISVQAAMVFLLAHALYKGTLFMVTGNVDHETGSRDLSKLTGLGKKMPYTFYAAALASLSMAGVIPFFGFIAKEILYGAAFSSPFASVLVGFGTFITGVMFAGLAFEFGYKIFTGKTSETPKPVHEAPSPMLWGPLALATIGLVGGVFSEQLAKPILHHSSNQILGVEHVLKLGLWHGFSLIFVLSLLTLLLGYLLFKTRSKILTFANKKALNNLPGPEMLYNNSIPTLLNIAKKQTEFFQSGVLRNYLIIITLTLLSVIWLSILNSDTPLPLQNFYELTQLRWYELVFVILMIIGIVNTLVAKSRLTSIVSLGLIGYGTAATFLYFGGPDVAMTQFLIETLTIVLFVLTLNYLPKFIQIKRSNIFKLMIPALLFGFTMTILLLWIHTLPTTSPIKDFYAQSSYLLAKGRNVVNVILVDFRGLDTMGEITVLAIASLGIFSMLKHTRSN
ncbi:MAG: DUF4040 domain-containing protein [Bacteroidales bacterium]|nr:DUF4040 domain-containing protein [Bacteroidales bacterium]